MALLREALHPRPSRVAVHQGPCSIVALRLAAVLVLCIVVHAGSSSDSSSSSGYLSWRPAADEGVWWPVGGGETGMAVSRSDASDGEAWQFHDERGLQESSEVKGKMQLDAEEGGAGGGEGEGEEMVVRWCCVGQQELSFCDAVVPELSLPGRQQWSCIQRSSKEECILAVSSSQAELLSLDAGAAFRAFLQRRLKAIAHERLEYGEEYHATAVVPASLCLASSFPTSSSSSSPSAADPDSPSSSYSPSPSHSSLWYNLPSFRSCHGFYGSAAGWDVPASLLLSLSLTPAAAAAAAGGHKAQHGHGGGGDAQQAGSGTAGTVGNGGDGSDSGGGGGSGSGGPQTQGGAEGGQHGRGTREVTCQERSNTWQWWHWGRSRGTTGGCERSTEEGRGDVSVGRVLHEGEGDGSQGSGVDSAAGSTQPQHKPASSSSGSGGVSVPSSSSSPPSLPAHEHEADALVVAESFRASCAPAGGGGSSRREGGGPSLCSGCSHGGSSASSASAQCGPDSPYYGPSGAFRCVMEGAGDIAFVPASVPLHFARYGAHQQPWATQDATHFRYLCPPPHGGCVDIVEDPVALNCTLAVIPADVIMTRNAIGEHKKQRILRRLLSAGQVAAWRTSLYEGRNPQSYLLSYSARGLVAIPSHTRSYLSSSGHRAQSLLLYNHNLTRPAPTTTTPSPSLHPHSKAALSTSSHRHSYCLGLLACLLLSLLALAMSA